MFNIITHPEYALSKVRKAEGREGEGVIFDLTLNKKTMATYADYGDGGGPDIHFVSQQARASLIEALLPHAREIFNVNEDEFPGLKNMYGGAIQALETGKDATYSFQPGDVRDVSVVRAEGDLIEHWLGEQAQIAVRVKDCKKGIAYIEKTKPWVVHLMKVPFTPENRQYIIDSEFKGDASKVEFYNETYGIIPTPVEAFEQRYGKMLKDEQTGKAIWFRVKDGISDGTMEGAWRAYKNCAPEKARAAISIMSNVESRLDILNELKAQAQRSMRTRKVKIADLRDQVDGDVPVMSFRG